jgi:alpha-mannosidase
MVFKKYLAQILCALFFCNSTFSQLKPDTAKNNSYYIDGYHGGKTGHMPPGSFRDIVSGLERYPSWKLSFDIEPVSWSYLKTTDPQTFFKLKDYLNDYSTNARLEIVSPGYMQSYCWNISGESNIRQLVMGLDELHKSFPGYPVRTYSVQEPCWTSSMPQILRSLGFTQAVLKDPCTAFGGYSRGVDKSILFWRGPDGTSIPAVPRYKCENLNPDAWETESCSITPDFIAKCALNGIKNPAGSQYQDLGWPAHPAVDSTGKYVYIESGLNKWPDSTQFSRSWWSKPKAQLANYPQLITWREYFKTVLPEPTAYWDLTQDDLQVNLMWGSGAINATSTKVHNAEKKILQAEKLSALASKFTKYELPVIKLNYAWEQLLMTQHHDAWIGPVADTNSDHWASFTSDKTAVVNDLLDDIISESISSLISSFQTADIKTNISSQICVINSTGFERTENVEAISAFDPGVKKCDVYDQNNQLVPSQLIPISYYGDGSVNGARIIFGTTVPSLGTRFFLLKPNKDPGPEVSFQGCRVTRSSDSEYILETDLYKVIVNTAKGGCITSLTDKSSNREYVDQKSDHLFNEYSGYFSLEKQWLSSKDSSATLQIIENGPLRIKALIKGKIGKYGFETLITLANGEKQLDFKTKFFFNKDVLIGEPWDGERPTRGQHRKPCYDSRYKLQAFFPAAITNQVVYKNAPYDVCTSRLDNTFFNSWDDMKHNIILDWVDVYDSISNAGLVVFNDRTTSYSHAKDYPLALTLGWSGYGLWESFYPMSPKLEFNYALVPHVGKWNDSGLSALNAAWNEPLVTRVINAGSANLKAPFSYLKASDPHIEISTLYFKEKALFVRLFNSNDHSTQSDLSLNFPVQKMEATELDGKVKNEIKVTKIGDRSSIHLVFRPFEIKTLRVQ